MGISIHQLLPANTSRANIYHQHLILTSHNLESTPRENPTVVTVGGKQIGIQHEHQTVQLSTQVVGERNRPQYHQLARLTMSYTATSAILEERGPASFQAGHSLDVLFGHVHHLRWTDHDGTAAGVLDRTAAVVDLVRTLSQLQATERGATRNLWSSPDIGGLTPRLQ